MIITDFCNNLFNELIEKGLTNTTANQYIKTLINIHKKLYDTEIINSLNFLKETQTIENLFKNEYSPNSIKTFYACFISVLSIVNNKKYAPAINHYRNLVMGLTLDDDKPKKNTMNLIQKANWIDWEDLLKITNEYNKQADEIAPKENITIQEYDVLLYNVIISLYTLIPPRRNDYMVMYVIPSPIDEDENRNYLQLNKNKLIFNKYKTSKTYGRQIIDELPLELINAIYNYLTHHPLYNNVRKNSKEWEIPLLVDAYGNHLNKINSITRILNKITGRKIGASMLRHIYITHKYGQTEKEKQTDANMMAHSVNMQKEYILYDDDDDTLTINSEDTDF